MNSYILFSIWALCLLSGCIGSLLHQKNQILVNRISGIIALLSNFTLLAFTWVFVINRSSNVAQLAGKDGIDLWKFWFDIFPLCFYSNLLFFILSISLLFFRPFPKTDFKSWLYRALVLAGVTLSICHLILFMPDA